MKIWHRVLGIACILAVATMPMLATGADSDEEKKYSTKEVMKACFKGPLVKKVATGKASEDETKQLVTYLVAMSKNAPKKGEMDSWKKKTMALVEAAKAVQAGKDGAGAKLGKAANCKACHSLHK